MISLLLSNRSWRHLFLAQVTSLVGTGISNIALALLAWDLAGANAGAVLGTALAIKMVAYVLLAPLAGAWAHKIHKKQWLAGLDIARCLLILFLPFVSDVWQIYVLIFLVNSCSAGFTPVFQSVIPQLLTNRDDYMQALSFSRIAYDLEQLASPLLAGLLLTTINGRDLFVFDAFTFLISALFIVSCSIPKSIPPQREKGVFYNLSFGISAYLKTPRLRALWALYFAVASGSAMLIVNTVVYVKKALALTDQDTAIAMAAAGTGSMLIALFLPRWLKKRPVRPFVLAGGFLISSALLVGALMPGWLGFLVVCLSIGMGLSFIQTPSGALVTKSSLESDTPAYFAANFSLSHFCWFLTYLLAGWGSARLGLAESYLLLGAISLAGTLYAVKIFPNPDPEILEHTHESETADHEKVRHSHRFVIDDDHRKWPK